MESTRAGVDTVSRESRFTTRDSRGAVKETRTVIGRQECIGRFNVHFQNMRPGHGTPLVNSGTIPAIPGRLATLGNFPLCKSFSAYYKIFILHTKFLLLLNLAIFEI